MRLIVGLGNPGAKYARNRHNIGFMAVDAIHERQSTFAPWRSRFKAEVSEGTLDGEKVLLMKPQTYMNESGRAVGEAARFFKLSPADVVVLYDELDLAPGKVRVKTGGGSGGHNGIKSIDAHLGKDYVRVRMGIGHPGHKDRVTAHVLGDFSKAERDWLAPLLEETGREAALLLGERTSEFCNRIHRVLPVRKQTDRTIRPASAGRHAAPMRKRAGRPPARKDTQPRSALAEGLARMFGKKD
ncbi:MAG: aminoacyl-tRNA hydrolase [Alphaproteobacteria bacterium]|nr:aminoacyl-tRNA hydrolase [Alphaproteobacteria bacterium]